MSGINRFSSWEPTNNTKAVGLIPSVFSLCLFGSSRNVYTPKNLASVVNQESVDNGWTDNLKHVDYSRSF